MRAQFGYWLLITLIDQSAGAAGPDRSELSELDHMLFFRRVWFPRIHYHKSYPAGEGRISVLLFVTVDCLPS